MHAERKSGRQSPFDRAQPARQTLSEPSSTCFVPTPTQSAPSRATNSVRHPSQAYFESRLSHKHSSDSGFAMPNHNTGQYLAMPIAEMKERRPFPAFREWTHYPSESASRASYTCVTTRLSFKVFAIFIICFIFASVEECVLTNHPPEISITCEGFFLKSDLSFVTNGSPP